MQDSETTVVEPNPFTERLGTEVAAEVSKKPSKGMLARVTTRKRRRPIFAVLYGPAGVGKSTWAAASDEPIFIPCERGLDQITVPKFPVPETLAEFAECLNAIDEEPHDYKTLVIDTLDALELLIFDDVIAKAEPVHGRRVTSLEDVGGGFQKGYVRAREYWQRLLKRLTILSERMNVLLLAHSHVKTFTDPMLGSSYDVFELKVHTKGAEMIKQAVDLLLFARLTTSIAKETPKARKGRALISGDRELYTQPTTGIDAKNRYNLESPMEFSWEALSEGIAKFYES